MTKTNQERVKVVAEAWKLSDQLGHDFALMMTSLTLMEEEHRKCNGICKKRIAKAIQIANRTIETIRKASSGVGRKLKQVERLRGHG